LLSTRRPVGSGSPCVPGREIHELRQLLLDPVRLLDAGRALIGSEKRKW
jgi:hypothetical protein